MAKNRQQKAVEVSELQEKIGSMTSVVFATTSGLKVKDVTELRKILRTEGLDFVMAKKTLLRRALTDKQMDATVVDRLDGSISLAFGYQDEVAPARVLSKYAKEHQEVKLVGGLVQGAYVDGKGIQALAKLPTREVLLAQTVATINAPISGFVQVLAGNIRSLITVLQAVKDKQPA